MPTTLNLEQVATFLDELSRNNKKTWFEQHRQDYEAAREAFDQFIDDLIDQLRASDQLQDLTAKECTTRIYRDIRFSKDKTPYKTNFAAMVAPGGRKTTRFGYHISIGPHEQTHVARGLYMCTPDHLRRFRRAIDSNAVAFKKVTRAKAFVEAFGEICGERLKTAPQGYDKAHPELGLLQLKQVLAVRRFPDPEVLADGFMKQVVKTCRAMKPFLDYLDEIMA